MTESGREKFTVTWRSYAAVMLAILGFFAVKIYERVDNTAEAVTGIKTSITALNERLNAQAERLADHDRRIGRLESPYFQPQDSRAHP